jgi:hypothetical protein
MDADVTNARSPNRTAATSLAISPWVNERPPPLQELLSAHDVAHLTRRPTWLLAGLSLVGRFPKKLKYQGRGIGWRRSEILDWMSRDLSVVRESSPTRRACALRRPRQGCLPFARTALPRNTRRQRP